jgi:putative acetyltransferase
MEIMYAKPTHARAIFHVHQQAFGLANSKDKGTTIRDLVQSLLADPSAEPRHSLVAVEQDTVVAHVLFTRARIEGAAGDVAAQILAPLAVHPDYQSKGIGGKLIMTGLDALRKSKTQLVFVLGHPGYYPRYGFTPAGVYGLEAPYPIPAEHAAAWMVQELSPGNIGTIKGKIRCATALHQPEHWRE